MLRSKIGVGVCVYIYSCVFGASHRTLIQTPLHASPPTILPTTASHPAVTSAATSCFICSLYVCLLPSVLISCEAWCSLVFCPCPGLAEQIDKYSYLDSRGGWVGERAEKNERLRDGWIFRCFSCSVSNHQDEQQEKITFFSVFSIAFEMFSFDFWTSGEVLQVFDDLIM